MLWDFSVMYIGSKLILLGDWNMRITRYVHFSELDLDSNRQTVMGKRNSKDLTLGVEKY